VAAYEPGALEARAYSGGKVVATEVVRTPGSPRRLVLHADDTDLIGDGADMTRVVAVAVDEQGTPVPNEDRRICVEVSHGKFLGENPIHLEDGRIAFYVQSREGHTMPITVRATAEGLDPSEPLLINVRSAGNSLLPFSDFDEDGLACLR
jgi:hypothetical protein